MKSRRLMLPPRLRDEGIVATQTSRPEGVDVRFGS
jgi:hypothetical protein